MDKPQTTPFEGAPDFINELGVKWWKDERLTRYAEKEDHNGIKLSAHVFYVETPEGKRTRILIDKDGPIYDAPTLEGMAAKIDILKLLEAKNV